MKIKKTIKSGNSSAVILPREWLNKTVRIELVEKSKKTILKEVLDILEEHIPLENVIGIYLAGSYARKEETEKSDIDLLVITKDLDKSIQEGIYSILMISKELLKQKLERDLLPVGQMIKESKALLNSDYLNFNIKVTKNNVKWYLDTTKEKILLIDKIIEKLKSEYVEDKVTYTLVLRIKTLYIIECLIKNKEYSNKNLIDIIKKVSGNKKAYEAYLNFKNNLNKKTCELTDIKKLQNYLKNYFKKIKIIL